MENRVKSALYNQRNFGDDTLAANAMALNGVTFATLTPMVDKASAAVFAICRARLAAEAAVIATKVSTPSVPACPVDSAVPIGLIAVISSSIGISHSKNLDFTGKIEYYFRTSWVNKKKDLGRSRVYLYHSYSFFQEYISGKLFL